jgi:hypothetical protein
MGVAARKCLFGIYSIYTVEHTVYYSKGAAVHEDADGEVGQ